MDFFFFANRACTKRSYRFSTEIRFRRKFGKCIRLVDRSKYTYRMRNVEREREREKIGCKNVEVCHWVTQQRVGILYMHTCYIILVHEYAAGNKKLLDA